MTGVRTAGRWLAIALATVLLGGCWLQVGNGGGNTRHNAVERTLTSATVGQMGERWREPADVTVSEPIIRGNRVYVTAQRFSPDLNIREVMAVHAYDRDTGSLVWERSLLPEGAAVQGEAGAVGLVDGALWVAYQHDGLAPCTSRIVRLDPADGTVLSTDDTPGTANALVAAGSLVAHTGASSGCAAQQIIVRDIATRAVVWSHTFPAGTSLGVPAFAHGKVVVPTMQPRFQDEALHAFEASGCGAPSCSPAWVLEDENLAVHERPAAGPDGLVFAVGAHSDGTSFANTVQAVDTATGQVAWRTDLRYSTILPGGLAGIAVADDTLYVTGRLPAAELGDADEGVLDAYPGAGCGQATCAPAWTVPFGRDRLPGTPPTVAGDVVYLGMDATSASAPAVVAAAAGGCGQPTCAELHRVPLASSGGGAFVIGADVYQMSVADGRVVVARFPIIGPLTHLISLGLPDVEA